eukprot:6198748-Pleurochrysis_carterae.AAC.5
MFCTVAYTSRVVAACPHAIVRDDASWSRSKSRDANRRRTTAFDSSLCSTPLSLCHGTCQCWSQIPPRT